MNYFSRRRTKFQQFISRISLKFNQILSEFHRLPGKQYKIVVENTDEEKIFDVSVSNGADEVEQGDEDNLIISVEAEEFHNLKNVLEENEIKINQYELIMKASDSVKLDDEASEKVINLLESIEDLDDVQNVHSNAEFSEGSFA